MPDYLSRLGATIVREEGRCGILYKGHNAVFAGLEPEELRQRFDEGMQNAMAHYTANLRAAGVHMDDRHVEQVAFAVVLKTLYMYNLWRCHYPAHRDQPLVVGERELEGADAHDECWRLCKREFGERYREFAAAMTGMSVAAFAKYEKRRTEFLNR